jgi:hypothetical protein
MEKAEKVKRVLKQLTGANPNLPIMGTVTELQEETCTLELDTGLSITDVRLKVSYGEAENYITHYPKIGSRAVALSISGDLSDLMLIKVDEIEKIEINQNGLVVLADSSDGKIQIKNKSQSLLDLFQLLTDTLKQLKVYTAAGASGTPLPDTQLKLNEFETGFKSLLK